MNLRLLCILAVAMLTATTSFGQRVRYSGSHHTTSHGGRYAGGSGSSHRGGHYRNTRTTNHYGRHKY
jgi:hypothetical protein